MTRVLDSVGVEKVTVRTAALARRDALPEKFRAGAARGVAARGLPFGLPPGSIVSGYSPIQSEFHPFPLMHALSSLGVQLALPVIVDRKQPLIFRAWNFNADTQRGQFGILQPPPSAPQVRPNILLVPLAAFDRTGHRIGYGAGFYDRTIRSLRDQGDVLAIGLAFTAQEIGYVPASAHDARLDLVLTEDETIDFRS